MKEVAEPFHVNETKQIVCYAATMITSEGFWQKENPLNYALPLFLLQLMLILVVTRLFIFILKPIRQPRVISELMGGIILGPSVLGKSKAFADVIFPPRGKILIETMANVGIVYFMFLVGVGMDATSLRRIGSKAVAIAVVGMILPFTIGALFSVYLIKFDEQSERSAASILFIGSILSVAAFPVLARILAELKLINSDLGKIALSSALVNDLISCVLLVLSINLVEHNSEASLSLLSTFLASGGFVVFNIFVVRPGILWMIRKTPEGEAFSDLFMCIILSGVMISGFITDFIGTHAVFGAFVFGLTIPNGPIGLSIVERLEDFITLLLLPLFFASNGLKTDLGLLKGLYTWSILIILVILACIGKIIGTIAAAFYYQISVRDGAALGLLMNTKGVIEVIVISVGKDQKVLTSESFASLMLLTVLMTAVIVPGMSFIYKPSRGIIPYKRRTIQMSYRETEFRVLVCIHTPRNVPTMIGLLDATSPSKNSPICIYLLHLTELSGHASALLILHNHTKKPDQPACNKTLAQTEHIVNAFQNYEQEASYVSVQPSTVISPYSTMHEDVCNLAQEKRVAFIILPFHKHQTVDGEMESTNISFRTVNLNVLCKAPCSVGILVDRGLSVFTHLAPDQKSHNVAVLFFGGPHDREALSYAWRMLERPGINLTVMRFVHAEEVMHHHSDPNPHESKLLTVETDMETEKKLDERFINWFRTEHEDNDSVVYVEKMVNNGEQTVSAIRSMDDIHDLFIIGRGQGNKSPLTAGLTDWSECHELGAIGDLLASSDFAATASVLIVQQYLGEGMEEDGLETDQEEPC
ncbi:hypothetical protein PHAVU_002G272700 [Phaseolus vulgaris]|uniref:Uncharacterized protein n=2 Tax=Phaseolus vulgaris TaxID=3885 RepID=V7CSE2_PHAVU|nr:hypothetical protein PHAVU_002G272700g [Phaseolus vulgaris]ESW31841.1 hypothetical protein PHAVU_002G272700g [Phaseolus vulgaris]